MKQQLAVLALAGLECGGILGVGSPASADIYSLSHAAPVLEGRLHPDEDASVLVIGTATNQP